MSLSNTQYDEIMRGYDEKQRRRRHLIEKRRETLYRKAPRLLEIDRELAKAGAASARMSLDGRTDALQAFRSRRDSLREEKDTLLSSLGCPPDYLNPPFACPDCEDTGYIGNTPCHCFRQAAIDLVYTQSNLKDILKEENFDHFSLKYYSSEVTDPFTGHTSLEDAVHARKKCLEFTQNFDHSFENILLFGNTGLGKTFLSHCVAKELLDTGHSVIYFSAGTFFEILSRNLYRRGEDSRADYRNIFSCDLLIIDDLGTEMPNSLTVSQFFVCLNERLMAEKSTLISTNLSLTDIAEVYSERISSRISNNFTLLPLYGNDIRIARRLEGS